jgi:hypothetical protein
LALAERLAPQETTSVVPDQTQYLAPSLPLEAVAAAVTATELAAGLAVAQVGTILRLLAALAILLL